MKNRLWFLFPIAQFPALIALVVAKLGHFRTQELFHISALALIWCALIIPTLLLITAALRCKDGKRSAVLVTCACTCAVALFVMFGGEWLAQHLGFIVVKYLHYPGPRFNGVIAVCATFLATCVSWWLTSTPAMRTGAGTGEGSPLGDDHLVANPRRTKRP